MAEEILIDKTQLMDAWDDYEHGRGMAKGLAGVLYAIDPDALRDDVAERAFAFLAEGAFAAAERMGQGESKMSDLLSGKGDGRADGLLD